MGDLTLSGRLPAGSRIQIDRKAGQESLHFTITATRTAADGSEERVSPREIPVLWEEETTGRCSGSRTGCSVIQVRAWG